jgi:hypothetical protein
MGPILQYVIGVPAGFYFLFAGLKGVYQAFTKPTEELELGFFFTVIAGLFAAFLGGAIVYSILFVGLDFGGGPGRLG